MICNGSGQLDICDTRVPHFHCVCLMPIEGKKYRANQRCWLCEMESVGERVHFAPSYYESLERIFDLK